MTFLMNSNNFMEYFEKVYQLIHDQGDYVTALDAATGDGDHWVNINSGMQAVIAEKEELQKKQPSEILKKVGMIMMSTIGGSSGVLYGSAFIEASKKIEGKIEIGKQEIYDILSGMLEGIMRRGNAKPGMKTMIDSLFPAVLCYKNGIENDLSLIEITHKVKSAAIGGAENTKNMEAVRGRAYYQADKGLGHLDPGAVTMSFFVTAMMDYISENIGVHDNN